MKRAEMKSLKVGDLSFIGETSFVNQQRDTNKNTLRVFNTVLVGGSWGSDESFKGNSLNNFEILKSKRSEEVRQSLDNSQILEFKIEESREKIEEFSLLDTKRNISSINPNILDPNLDTINGPISGFFKEKPEKKEVKYRVMIFPDKDCHESKISIREVLSESLKKNSLLEEIDFYDAFKSFSALGFSDLEKKKVWKSSFFLRFCKCFNRNEELDSQVAEICEKFVMFGYAKFRESSDFHRNLLLSSGSIIFSLTGEDLELRYCTILTKLKTKSRCILAILMNILFLHMFFPTILKKYTETMKSSEVLKAMKSLSKLTLSLLRKEHLNSLLNRTQKNLELIFFVFAGTCVYFIMVLKKSKKLALSQTKTSTKERLEDILTLSKRYYLENNTK